MKNKAVINLISMHRFKTRLKRKFIMSSKLFMFWKIGEQLLYFVYEMKSLLPFPSILYLKNRIPKIKRVDDRLSSLSKIFNDK